MVIKPKKKILVVDDELDFVVAVKTELEAANYSVITTTVPAEAVTLVRNEKPDLVIIDVVMPMVDGYHVCEYLKRSEAMRHVPVLLTSGRRIEDVDKMKAKAMGADAYLIKPIDLQQLVREVRILLQK